MVQVFLDGVCHLCSIEGRFLKQNDTLGSLQFIDISSPDFRAEDHGLNASRVHLYFQVKKEGVVLEGVPAFAAVWASLPHYAWVSRLLLFPGLFQLAKLGYLFFAWVRPLLPKRKASVFCEWQPPASSKKES
jgi:predicted DCC family thiol-disulfide oxidoreductase YuxK